MIRSVMPHIKVVAYPYTPGDNLEGIIIYHQEDIKHAGMIMLNPADGKSYLVNQSFFDKYYANA